MNVSCKCYFLIRDKCFKQHLHCRSNLYRNKNVIPPVITKFLKLVSKCYKMFLANGNERNTGVTQKQSHTEEGQH